MDQATIEALAKLIPPSLVPPVILLVALVLVIPKISEAIRHLSPAHRRRARDREVLEIVKLKAQVEGLLNSQDDADPAIASLLGDVNARYERAVANEAPNETSQTSSDADVIRRVSEMHGEIDSGDTGIRGNQTGWLRAVDFKSRRWIACFSAMLLPLVAGRLMSVVQIQRVAPELLAYHATVAAIGMLTTMAAVFGITVLLRRYVPADRLSTSAAYGFSLGLFLVLTPVLITFLPWVPS